MANTESFDFTDFIKELIDNTMNAIFSAHIEQEQKIADLVEDLQLADEELIIKYDLIKKAKDLLGTKVTNENAAEILAEFVANHRAVTAKLLEKGVPKCLIDKGKLLVKAIITTGKTQKNLSNKIFAAKLAPTKVGTNLPKLQILPVRGNEKITENSLNVVSEICLEFRTVIE